MTGDLGHRVQRPAVRGARVVQELAFMIPMHLKVQVATSEKYGHVMLGHAGLLLLEMFLTVMWNALHSVELKGVLAINVVVARKKVTAAERMDLVVMVTVQALQ